MRRLVLLLLSMALGAAGCADQAGSAYFPLEAGHQWAFGNVREGHASQAEAGGETLTVQSETPEGVGFSREVEQVGVEGFLSGALAGGRVRVDGSRVLFTGRLPIYVLDEENRVGVDVVDMPLFDEAASPGQVLYEKDGLRTDQPFEVVVEGTLRVKCAVKVTQGPRGRRDGRDDVISSTIEVRDASVRFRSEGVSDAYFEILSSTENLPMVSTNDFVAGLGPVRGEDKTDMPFKLLDALVAEMLGATIDHEALLAAGAPDLHPETFTVVQTPR